MIRAELEDVAVTGDASTFLLLLKTETQDYVAMTIDALQAQMIMAGRLGTKLERPLTHDLLLSALELLNAKVLRVEITELKNNTYYAQLVLENRGVEFELDARPSDALAVAVRTDAEIWISEEVVALAGLTDDFENGPGGVEA